ncbi:dephospho-CoA kinase [Longibacter salinarum]|uniref:Dephospho-CoA kinase n=1 Tax=Longibacter salinarum TaxID=1850348 RepID=A0A2A8CTM9_9BACT|nr:dephospho-CoA kinase [Longibacter salinarum]PEN11229.1 dephospho-CoA kinase [Longibacter salinarum]
MTTLGVTGGIGSGKTTVCGFLAEQGARVFYADLEARRLMTEHDGIRDDITNAFGDDSYQEDGSLNRAYLADVVFNSPENVEKINAIVHPRVHEAFAKTAERARDEGVEVLVHEAALIFESGGDKHLDAVAVVVAPDEERIARVVDRDDTTPDEVRARMSHQLSQDELRRRADYVVENDGSLDDLRQKSIDLYRTITGP